MMKRNTQRGFTLMELLISLAVFSVLSVMAYSGLRTVLDSRVHTEQQADRLIDLQRAFTFLGRDIEQTTARSVRDYFGDEKAAFIGAPFGENIIELTRGGWANPNTQYIKRSTMERVIYRYSDEKLIRRSLAKLDQTEEVFSGERELLSDIKEFKIRYFDSALQWHDTWPPDFGEDANLNSLPRAVEVTIDYKGFGEVRRLFRVSPGEYVLKKRKDSEKNKANEN